ncbi:hypothetical protein VSDG_01771 [Cytospora chrysosperma]|uniref:Uncharacterized protein n=1 Tax=Cytospora chrysosperma TaxID=252740 RepID=A0A423WHN8_CYTCH|nr:hypothetical protein VSDG_01771 [Valsa sordida]
MLAPVTLIVLSPFVLSLSRAVVVEPRNGSYGFSANVTLFRQGTLTNVSSTALMEIINYPCDKNTDPRPCYKQYYEEKHSCHPFDQECYKDCHNWDDYRHRCEDRGDKCYDKCYYEDRECHRYDKCQKDRGVYRSRGDEQDCYKKHKDYYDHQDHCKPECGLEEKECYKCRKECPPWEENCSNDYRPPRYCKPDCQSNDNSCHKCREPDRQRQHDRECEPRQDRDCFPGYPHYPEYPEGDGNEKGDYDDDYHPHHPKSYITVNYFGQEGTYQEKVWPDGDEHWNDEHFGNFKVDHIKYYAEHEDSDVRCLPMKSWFPWTPLPLEKFVERTEEYDLVVRILQLEKPMPIELIRCDIP